MTTMSTPYATTHPSYADDDTLRLPLPTTPIADRSRSHTNVRATNQLWSAAPESSPPQTSAASTLPS